MGSLVYFCAGADANNLPKSPIDALLINALDHGSTPRKIQDAQRMCRRANQRHLLGDSSGFQILMGEEKGKLMTFDPDQPMKNTAKFLNISPQQVMEVIRRFDCRYEHLASRAHDLFDLPGPGGRAAELGDI